MSEPQNQKAKTETFRALHQGKILILPNAWDAASARIVQQAGFSAIATTSAGIAFTLGYGDCPEDAARTARDVLVTGAVGMNLEDATGNPQGPLFDPTLQVERIKAV